MSAFIAWLRRVLGVAEHATVEGILKPLTDIHDKLTDLHAHATAAADAAHVRACDALDEVERLDSKADAALAAKATLSAIIPGATPPAATPPTGATGDVIEGAAPITTGVALALAAPAA